MSRARRLDLRTTGVLTTVVVVLVLVTVFTQSFRAILREEGRAVTVTFPSAPQLYEGDEVRIEGRKEGEVEAVERTPTGAARITLEIADDAGPLYGNAHATLSWKTLLGGVFAINLDRGTPNAGPLASTGIPPEQTSRQVELEDLQGVLRGEARTGLRSVMRELGDGLADEAGPARALAETARIAPDAAAAARAMRGQRAGDDVPRLVRGATATMRALDAPDDDLRRLVAGAAATLRTTAGRDRELGGTLAALPGATTAATRTLRRLDDSLLEVDRLVSALRPVAPGAAPALRRLRVALEPTDALLRGARPVFTSLRPAARSLARAARPGRDLVVGLEPDLDRLDGTVLPYLTEPDRVTGKPTSTMFGAAFAHLGGLMSQKDGNGHFMRFPVTGGNTTAPLPCKTAISDGSTDQMLACQTLQEAFGTYLEFLEPFAPTAAPKESP